jgi:hypothetical protein
VVHRKGNARVSLTLFAGLVATVVLAVVWLAFKEAIE